MKISIIIPAYNAAKSIAATIDSVRAALARLSDEGEIIVVDDGSTDGTGDVAEGFGGETRCAADGPVLRVVHRENGGAYAARTSGVNLARGEWIGFVDADDAVEPDLYVKLIAFAERHDLQVAECDIAGYRKRGRDGDLWIGRGKVRDELAIPWLIEGNEASFMWDKIYRRDVWPNEMHPSQIFMYDDLMTNLQVFRAVERFGILHEPLYRYQVNEGSSVRRFGRRNIRDFREIVAFRNMACGWYGIRQGDPRMRRWVRINLLNNLKLAVRSVLKR